jgi:tryptophan-rich sensory protein
MMHLGPERWLGFLLFWIMSGLGWFLMGTSHTHKKNIKWYNHLNFCFFKPSVTVISISWSIMYGLLIPAGYLTWSRAVQLYNDSARHILIPIDIISLNLDAYDAAISLHIISIGLLTLSFILFWRRQEMGMAAMSCLLNFLVGVGVTVSSWLVWYVPGILYLIYTVWLLGCAFYKIGLYMSPPGTIEFSNRDSDDEQQHL